jgi:alpha-glucuronidase
MEYSSCWLQYKKISDHNTDHINLYLSCDIEHKIIEHRIIEHAIQELVLAFDSLYGRSIIRTSLKGHDSKNFMEDGLKTENWENEQKENLLKENIAHPYIELRLDAETEIAQGGYTLNSDQGYCTIQASSDIGILYGVFALVRNIQVQRVVDFERWSYKEEKEPKNPYRMLNHWDNMDGSIERGYSGTSFFFQGNEIIINERIKAYARMVSSIGINGVVINNVNVRGAASRLISEEYYEKLRLLSEIFSSYGIQLFLSINFAAPMELGGLTTADPMDEKVCRWWEEKAKEIWSYLPDFGGFLVKADSEGRPGPFTYDRTHADGANMLANAVRPYKGMIIWRCFVYNCQQDWRDRITDRAKAGFDNFMPLDGQFMDNVILQIKNGPMDFQVREPISPLFGGLHKTNQMLEVQIAQEYTGQQRHVCYLIPWFKEILESHTYCNEEDDKVSDIISGRTYQNKNCGIAAVANTGNDYNWTGHDLAASNLYGIGRLSFDTELTAEDIAREWILQSFNYNEVVFNTVHKILMTSWKTYEKYTSPLGIGWMVKPNHHYGPDIDGYEYDKWGTYHRADHIGIGIDRTKEGTGFTKQYQKPLARLYEERDTCPEELILFFHRLEYNYVLSTGKTVIQHIYDTHFEGAKEAEEMLAMWVKLQGLIEEDVYERALKRFQHQSEHAREWRDVVNSYFYRKSGIDDQYGRKIY